MKVLKANLAERGVEWLSVKYDGSIVLYVPQGLL